MSKELEDLTKAVGEMREVMDAHIKRVEPALEAYEGSKFTVKIITWFFGGLAVLTTLVLTIKEIFK